MEWTRPALVAGALVAVCGRDGSARPGLVTAVDDQHVSVHVAGDCAFEPGDDAVLAWGVEEGVRELRGRVLRCRGDSRELVLDALGAAPVAGDDRRSIPRTALAADALLIVGDAEHPGGLVDISALGAGLRVRGDAPAPGDAGVVVVHDAGELLVPGAAARVEWVGEADDHGRYSVGIRFADPARSAEVTSRLLEMLERRV